jgi:hypothetical protein
MDRAREALRGDEVRACWQSPPGAAEPLGGLFAGLGPPPAVIIPVEMGGASASASGAPGPQALTLAAGRPSSADRAARDVETWRDPLGPDQPVSLPEERHGAPEPASTSSNHAASLPGFPSMDGVRRFLPVAMRSAGHDRVATDEGPAGRLVDAPVVAPTGRIGSVAEQLRRAERHRAAAGSLDAERLGGPDGVEPTP